MTINTLTGALAISFLRERPFSFSAHSGSGALTVAAYPHPVFDFEAVAVAPSGAVICAPTLSALALSYYFSMCGLPRGAISVISENETSEIPIIDSGGGKIRRYPIKCKQSYSKTVVFSGGMEHTVYTQGGKNRARIIEAPSESDFSRELLSRLSVIDGLPDTVRSVAYRRVGGVYRMASTDNVLTLDSVIPLAGLIAQQGVCGRVDIICRGITFPFILPEAESGVVYIDAHALFPLAT